MHIMDEEELTFPFDGNTRFEGMEQGGDLIGEARVLRDGYMEALEAFMQRVKRGCVSNRIGYALVRTGDHIGAALAAFLARRRAARSGAKRR
jgi:hypothetical protein